MHPEDIKSTLKKNGSSQADVARKVGVSPKAVHLVIQGFNNSRRIAMCISAETGISVDVLFPGRGYEKER